MAAYTDPNNINSYYGTTQSNAANRYNSMFSGGGGNPGGVYNKPGSSASALASRLTGSPATKPALASDPGFVSLDPLLNPPPVTQQPQPSGVSSSFLNFYNQPGGFNPFSFGMGMNPGSLGINYSGQNPNLGRYVPPMMYGTGSGMQPGNWMNSGGYAYNSPNSYGSAGVFNYPIWS